MGLASAWAPLSGVGGGGLSSLTSFLYSRSSSGRLSPLWSDSHFAELKSLRFPGLEMKTTLLMGFC